MDWHRIDGVGTLLQATAHEGALPFQTRSQRLTFGLVRLDGTENAMLARLGFGLDVAKAGLRVRLARAPEPVAHPAQAAWFTTELDVK